MLACIVRSRNGNGSDESSLVASEGTPRCTATKDALKPITQQVKGMAVKLSKGAYRQCLPCRVMEEGGMVSESYEGSPLDNTDTTDTLDATSELSIGCSDHNGTPVSVVSNQYFTPPQSFKATASTSGRDTPKNHYEQTRKIHGHRQIVSRDSCSKCSSEAQPSQDNTFTRSDLHSANIPLDERKHQVSNNNGANVDSRFEHNRQIESKVEGEGEHVRIEMEWVAQIEPGVLITFLALEDGRNDLKRIRFSREMFNRSQAQQWWAENCDKVYELYNVPTLSGISGTLPMVSKSEQHDCTSQSIRECKRQFIIQQNMGQGVKRNHEKRNGENLQTRSMAKLGSKDRTGVSSKSLCHLEMEAKEELIHQSQHELPAQSNRCGCGIHHGGCEDEWVEEDEPGIYITLKSCNGPTELKCIHFREKFTELQARMWWDENRIRVYNHYL
ncbi:hypothetical protein KP509_07G055100 [Ceratopteris richardii]|uniref:BRX domain-containing protein n=2 Tax=Ceratopteris richardii TaxID=49495 RepID=A0A8T2UID8_CERRI|nr:hypothetical protein KP509_07G055100 [Ceratopteris richardii]